MTVINIKNLVVHVTSTEEAKQFIIDLEAKFQEEGQKVKIKKQKSVSGEELARIAKAQEKEREKKPRLSHGVDKTTSKWTEDEILLLLEHRNHKSSFVTQLPELVDRHTEAGIQTMHSIIRMKHVHLMSKMTRDVLARAKYIDEPGNRSYLPNFL